MTELSVTFDEKSEGLDIRVSIRENETTTQKEADGAALMAQEVNRLMRVAEQLASFRRKDGGAK